MMSQQQNLSMASQPLLQQTGSEADVKPFSIRQYVLASRHRSILHSWPFPEKYLQICLNHGLRDVLPPLGRETSLAESLKVCSNLMHSRNDSIKADFCKPEVPHLIDDHTQTIKNECDYKVSNHSPSSHEEGNQQKCNNVSANLSQSTDTCTLPSSIHDVQKSTPLLMPSSKAMKDKRKRRRGRCKKRSMVDILAVARHCTLEEIYRMNKFCYAETVLEGCCQQNEPFENFSEPELAGEDSCKRGGSEDHGVANVDNMAGKGSLLLKFKLNGCNVNRNCET